MAAIELPPDPLDPLKRPRYDYMCDKKKSNQSGVLCRGRRKMGMKVCKMHGGRAPQTILAAQKRIDTASLQLVNVAIGIAVDKGEEARDRLSAVKEVLNRSNVVRQPAATTQVQTDVQVGGAFVEVVQAAVESVARKEITRKQFAIEDIIDVEVEE